MFVFWLLFFWDFGNFACVSLPVSRLFFFFFFATLWVLSSMWILASMVMFWYSSLFAVFDRPRFLLQFGSISFLCLIWLNIVCLRLPRGFSDASFSLLSPFFFSLCFFYFVYFNFPQFVLFCLMKSPSQFESGGVLLSSRFSSLSHLSYPFLCFGGFSFPLVLGFTVCLSQFPELMMLFILTIFLAIDVGENLVRNWISVGLAFAFADLVLLNGCSDLSHLWPKGMNPACLMRMQGQEGFFLLYESFMKMWRVIW